MPANKTRKFNKCINEIRECINDGPIWDQAGWEATVNDIDIKIEQHKASIRRLLEARKVAHRNLDGHKKFSWAQAEQDVMRQAPESLGA